MPPTNIAKIRHPQILTAPTNRAATPPSLRPVIVGQLLPDPSVGHSYEAQGYVRILGGQPNKPVTPPTYWSPLQVSGAASAGMAGQRGAVLSADESNSKDQRAENGQVIQLGGKPNNPVTPPRPTLITQANSGGGQGYAGPMSGQEDLISFSVPPSGTILTTYGAKLAKPQTPIIVSGAGDSNSVLGTEDLLSQPYPPYGVILGGRPNKAVTPPRPSLITVAYSGGGQGYIGPTGGSEDLLSYSVPPPVVVLGGEPNKAVTPPRPTLVLTSYQGGPGQGYFGPSGGAEDIISLSVPPTGTILVTYGAKLAKPQTPLIVSGAGSSSTTFGTEDVLSQPYPPHGVILGGRPNKAVTPPSPQEVLIASGAGDTSSTFPGANGIEDTYSLPYPPFGVILGGLPNAPVTPRSLRTVTLAQPVEQTVSPDVFTPASAAPRRSEGLALVLGGKPSFSVTPPSLRPVLVFAEPPSPDYSVPPQFLVKTYVKPAAAVGIASIQPIIARADDSLVASYIPGPYNIQAPASGISVLYLCSTASSTVGTDNTLVTTPPSPETSNSTSTLGTGWFILWAQGTIGSSGGGTEPGQNDEGFLWDVTTLEGQTLKAGNYSATVKLSSNGGSTGGNGVDIHVRVAKRNSTGTIYTPIVDLVLTGQTITTTATVFHIPAAAGPAINFGVGDKLYVDVLLNVSNTGTANGFNLFQNGGVNESLTIPGWSASPSVTSIPIVFSVQAQEDLIFRGRHAEAFVLGGVSRPSTGPRPLLREIGPADDLSPQRHGEAVVQWKHPGRNVTPPTLRPIYRDQQPADDLSWQRHPEARIFRTDTTRAASQILPTPIIVPAEDNLSYQRHPYAIVLTTNVKGAVIAPHPVRPAMPEDQVSRVIPPTVLLWTPFTTVVNKPIIPHPPRIYSVDDSLTAALVTPPVLLWTRPNYPTVHPPQLIPGVFMVEDTVTPQEGRAVLSRTWRFPPGTPPSLPITTVTPIDQQGVLYAGYQAQMNLITAPSPPVTKPTLRPVNVVLAEDVLSHMTPPSGTVYGKIGFQLTLRPPIIASIPDVFSEQVPAEGRIYGGKPNRPVTRPTLRTPLVITAEDTFTPPKHPEALIYGGRPSKGVSPSSLRTPIIVLAEDVLTPPRHPEGTILQGPIVGGQTKTILRPILQAAPEDVLSQQRHPEAWVLSGPRRDPIKGIRPPLVITAEDVISTQRLPDPQVIGGKPVGPVTPRTLRLVYVVPCEDVISPIPPPTVLYGGKPNRPVTPRTLRSVLLSSTPDVFSVENVPPPILLKGAPLTQISPVPPTKIVDRFQATVVVGGSYTPTVKPRDTYKPTVVITGKAGG